MTYPIMPNLHGYSISKRPTFATTIQTAQSGREVTRFQQTLPLWEFELKYEILQEETQNSTVFSYFENKTDLQQIMGLFTACGGEYGLFYFEDLSDNSRTKQGIGIGDGVETSFRLVRTISYGEILYTEPVGGINLDESITVFLDDVAVPQIGNWEISDDLTTLVFDSPPGDGQTIKITFHYRYLCRFITNEAEFEQFMYNRWAQNGLRFRSLNLYASGVGVTSPTFVDPTTPPIEPEIQLPPGTYYWEITLVEGGTGYVNWGIAFGISNSQAVLIDTVNASINLPQANSQYADFMTVVTDGFGGGAPAWGYPLRPTAGSTHNAAADGQVYSIAVNTFTHRRWWRAATGADTRWNASALADPVTGVGGQDISASGESPVIGFIFALVGATQGAAIFVGPYDSPASGTVNFGDSAFVGTPPVGYVSPASVAGAGVCTLNPDDNSTLSLSNGNLTFLATQPTGASNQGNPYSCVRSNFSIEQS